MISFNGESAFRLCGSSTRRDFLHAGSLAFLGLTLPDLFRLQAHGAVAKDVNCIFLFLVGGPPQLDTWDMKPDAPAEVRGPYRPVATNVSGIRVSELFPRMARHADKYALLRSFYHKVNAHALAHELFQTGRPAVPGLTYPSFGCVVSSLKGDRGELPANVILPVSIKSGRGQSAGFLGKRHEPLLINSDPSLPEFQVRDLTPPGYVASVQVERRRRFRDLVDGAFRRFERESADVKLADSSFDQAYRILSSESARAGFDIGAEPDGVRHRYGMNRFGQSCLLARRLVERGVRFVTVNMFDDFGGGLSWDIHGGPPFTPLTSLNTLGPMFDNAFTSLIEDLHERGLLRQTLVIAAGEFGRTPKINSGGGRDHWPSCGTIVLAGGGIAGGQAVGSSDRIGAEPRDRPVRPDEFLATIYHALGISLETHLAGPQNRPIPVVELGVKPVLELFGS